MGPILLYINDEKNVIVANYSGGNIAVFGKNNDGSIGNQTSGSALWKRK
jgi:6-phosphogluconolactonase (cycloisomerase 2 family)